MAPKAADVASEPTGADARIRASVLLAAGLISVAGGFAISRLFQHRSKGQTSVGEVKPPSTVATVKVLKTKEPGELLILALPDLVTALRKLPQSLDDLPELTELLQTTQERCQDPMWMQRRDEPVTDLAEWLCDKGDHPQAASTLVELSSRRQVLMEKLEELHDLKWDVPFDAEEEAIKENKIARDAAGME